ncbi:Smr/MutS family protein [Microbacteriaceae bacterium K1510]|nr:Smr/MutS family protein [Microbacteriaceae bacterium K1510]
MSTRDGNKRRPLSREERVLWKAVTQSIVPRRKPTEIDDEVEAPEAPPPAKTSKGVTPREAIVAPRIETRAPPPLAPLGRRMKQRVVRGKEPIDGRLDLHGLTQSEAHSALLRFLRNAVARDARLVLVITGKGRRDGEGERGVLKRQVPHWLALPEFRALVIGFENAHIAHGGEGALYVRLRRSREE